MNSKKLESKLKSYTALATSVIAVSGSVNAQVVYTDVNPDFVCTNNGAYSLNLNNDMVNDFTIEQLTLLTSYNSVYSIRQIDISAYFNNNEVFVDGSNVFAKALNANNVIGAAQTTMWSTYAKMNRQGMSYGNPISEGNWIGQTDKYLGLRFLISGQYYYGWARLDVDVAANSFIIKDYAYESTPNKSILAGDKGTVGVADNMSVDNIVVGLRHKTLFVDFKDNDIKGGVIKLYDLLGQEIISVEVTGNRMEINVEDVGTGIYLCNVCSNQGIVTRKIQLK